MSSKMERYEITPGLDQSWIFEKAIAERVNGLLKDEFEILNRRLSMDDAKRNVNHAIKIYHQKRPHWSCQFLTPNQPHDLGKFKLKKYSKFQFSKTNSLILII